MAQRLTGLTLNEVSFVDSPANKGARFVLFKRKEPTLTAKAIDLLRKAGLLPGTDSDGAVGFETAYTNNEIQEELWECNSALQRSISSILADETITDKTVALRDSFAQFEEHILALISGKVQKIESVPSTGAVNMPDAIKKALGLAEAATEADVLAKIAEFAKSAKDTGEKLETFAKRSERIAKMDADTKAHWATLIDKAADNFADMTPEERAAEMKKKPATKSDDETFTTAKGQVVSKRAVGDAVFAIMKAQEDEHAATRAQVTKLNDDAARETVTKRVSVLKFVGKAEDIGTLLHTISKSAPEAAKEVEKLLGTLDERIGKSALFTESGNGASGSIGSASAAITKAAEEIRKAKPMTIEKARVEARKANPELAKQEETEARDARKARAA